MKVKKIIFKVTNYSLFTFYLAVCLAFAGGINIRTDKNGSVVDTRMEDTYLSFPTLYDNPWEIAETVCLGLLFVNNICNLIFRKKKVRINFTFFIILEHNCIRVHPSNGLPVYPQIDN